MQKKLDAATETKLDILHRAVRLDLTVNDLRILVGCMRAIAYQMEIDNEGYLDVDGQALKERLELLYLRLLGENGSTNNADLTTAAGT